MRIWANVRYISAIFISLVILISVNITHVTTAKAKIFDCIEIALYVIPVVISVVATYMIAHRIYYSSRKIKESGIGGNEKLKNVLEIVIQSSAIYTIMLLGTVGLDMPVPAALRSGTRETAYHYISALMAPISVRLVATFAYKIYG